MPCVVKEILEIAREDFIHDYWAQRPRTAHCSAAILAALPNVRRFTDLLALVADRPESIQLAQNGSTRTARRLIDGRLDLEALWSEYHEGASIVLNSIFRVDVASKALCERLLVALGHRVQANGYLTPPGARGFATHYDTHDVIVVQLYGTKHWNIFDPQGIVSPHPRIHDARLTADHLEKGTSSAVTLTPGSVLYLPRGFPHKARTGTDPSLHITFSLDAISVAEVLRALLYLLEDCDENFRHHVSTELFKDPSTPVHLNWVLEPLERALNDRDIREQAIRSVRRSAIQAATITPIGTLRTDIGNQVRVRWRDEVFSELTKLPDGHFILMNGIKGVKLSPMEGALLTHLIDRHDAQIGDLKTTYGEDAAQIVVRLTALGLAELMELPDEG